MVNNNVSVIHLLLIRGKFVEAGRTAARTEWSLARKWGNDSVIHGLKRVPGEKKGNFRERIIDLGSSREFADCLEL